MDAFADKPYDPRKSVRDAWQRAADKHGETYANDIFPDGKPEPPADADAAEALDQLNQANERNQ